MESERDSTKVEVARSSRAWPTKRISDLEFRISKLLRFEAFEIRKDLLRTHNPKFEVRNSKFAIQIQFGSVVSSG